MRLDAIGFYTLSDARARRASDVSPLWRCELVLTDRCNFRCPYCRGLRADCTGDMPMVDALRTLHGWCDQGLRHVRFSGGEPTLYHGIGDLVDAARVRGVKRIAISSNGTASESTYLDLTRRGVNDWSISLDACCAAHGKQMAGGRGGWSRVVRNIRMLARLTYVTVGIVLTADNEDRAVDIVTYAHELGVDDIRWIPAAQYPRMIDSLSSLPHGILDAHPILRYRIGNLRKGRSVRGLREQDSRRCSLVLDDMAVAGRWHFPCIIYMREQGQPIGRIADPDVRGDRDAWSRSHDSYSDPICRANCLDVCIDYNNTRMKVPR